ncbi:hypothetical protein FNU76_20890 [Chitinimonas arctica]|uniref:FlgO domain-containing protein n=1 Tax=Chitinimonas arctica TaxID=2594795 RepID=A0A516SKD5_9NEIS|nr:hypothetical protein [Chitinimonas arctica]QDQ28610.1 hypothetical protein FNU76_20890 [Chitinimonas arctica]
MRTDAVFRRLALLSLLSILVACAGFPRGKLAAVAVPPGTKVLRAPADWGELARDAAFRMSQRASQLKDMGQKPIFVSEPAKPTPFALALRQYLQSNLTELGLTVAQRKGEGMLMLDADVQSVRLASGLQVVVTTAIGNGSRYLFRGTEAYAVDQADVKLYDESLLPPPPAPPDPPTPVKRINVTGA